MKKPASKTELRETAAMKKQLWKIILICPFLLASIAMSTKDLENRGTEAPPPGKDGQEPQLDIDLSTGDMQEKKLVPTTELPGQYPDAGERIAELERKIDSLETEITRLNNSKKILQTNYEKEKERVSELENEVTILKGKDKTSESEPEEEVLKIILDNTLREKDSVKEVEKGAYNIEEDERYIKLKKEHSTATVRIGQLERKIAELEKLNEENRKNYDREIQSLKKTIGDYEKASPELAGHEPEMKEGSQKKPSVSTTPAGDQPQKPVVRLESEDVKMQQPTAPQEPEDVYQQQPAVRLETDVGRDESSEGSKETPGKKPERVARVSMPSGIPIGEIFFESGKAVIDSAGKKVLDQLFGMLASHPGSDIMIVGHTDNVVIGPVLRARYSTNWDLAARRAAVVALYLQDKLGINPVRMTVVSYAQFHPSAPNSTEEGKARNRRVEIFILDSDR
jgi:chemotaxis protein MotB